MAAWLRVGWFVAPNILPHSMENGGELASCFRSLPFDCAHL
jgi:hypothetical protein